MKIAFISLIEDVSIPSLRYLSAYLRAKHHETTLVLLPWAFTDSTLNVANSSLYPYPNQVLEQITEICHGSDLIGLSLMSCHFDNAIHVTNFLRKRLSVPIIWGGIHPTLRPAECLEYADMACIGEGELSLSQLASEMSQGKSWQSLSIPGIAKRGNGQPQSMLPSPIIENLDELPFPDFDLDHQFIFYKGNIVPSTSNLLVKCLDYSYRVFFSRGCPYACTYCCNYALRRLYPHKQLVRWRSVDNRIKELKTIVELMPQLEAISLFDDATLAQPTEEVTEFARRYGKEIGLPLTLLTTPRSVSETKLGPLIKAGLYSIGLGGQSGSERILRGLYSRPELPKDLLVASACIDQVSHKYGVPIIGRYDFILDNPWESEDDVYASIRLCMQLKKPYFLALFSLTFYPGTELYRKARQEGIITDDLNQVYRQSMLNVKRTYLNGAFYALSANVPNWVVALLIRKQVRRWCPVWFTYRVGTFFELLKLFKGFLRHMVRGDRKLIRYLLRWALSRLRFKLISVRKTRGERPRFRGGPGEFYPKFDESLKLVVPEQGDK